MINNNLLLMTDSYKSSHWLQYPEGTEYVSSYIESRRRQMGSHRVLRAPDVPQGIHDPSNYSGYD